MQKTLLKQKKLKRIQQISENHCGPAVIQMLLLNLGIEASQEDITRAGKAEATINKYGTRVDQLALAVYTLAPHVCFWYKENASLIDLIKILEKYHYPVGIEWQGLFEDSLEEEDDDGDYGHYSITSHINEQKEQLIIVDPYKSFVKQDRIVPVDLFLQRWWDWNMVVNPKTGNKKYIKNHKRFFVVTLKTAKFPIKLKMKTYTFTK